MIHKIAKMLVLCMAVVSFSAKAMDEFCDKYPLTPANRPKIQREAKAQSKKIKSLEEGLDSNEKENLKLNLIDFKMYYLDQEHQILNQERQKIVKEQQRLVRRVYQEQEHPYQGEPLALKKII